MSNLAATRISLLCAASANSASLRYPFSFLSLFLPALESAKLR
jgi:hypothetical protein